MELSKAKVYVGTYAKYNNGSLAGEWVDLSKFYCLEDFLEYCVELHSDEDAPEFMFQDWENIPDDLISECLLNEVFFELRDEMEELTDTEKEAFCVWLSNYGHSVMKEAHRIVSDFQADYRGRYESEEEFVEEMLEQMGEELSDFARLYFDCEAFARDLFISDYWFEDGFVFKR